MKDRASVQNNADPGYFVEAGTIEPLARSTGSCLLPNGTVVNAQPSQFRVNGDCSVTGARQNGLVASSGRFQAGKRGIIGRVFVYDGKRLFGGSFVAVKRA